MQETPVSNQRKRPFSQTGNVRFHALPLSSEWMQKLAISLHPCANRFFQKSPPPANKAQPLGCHDKRGDSALPTTEKAA